MFKGVCVTVQFKQVKCILVVNILSQNKLQTVWLIATGAKLVLFDFFQPILSDFWKYLAFNIECEQRVHVG